MPYQEKVTGDMSLKRSDETEGFSIARGNKDAVMIAAVAGRLE